MERKGILMALAAVCGAITVTALSGVKGNAAGKEPVQEAIFVGTEEVVEVPIEDEYYGRGCDNLIYEAAK